MEKISQRCYLNLIYKLQQQVDIGKYQKHNTCEYYSKQSAGDVRWVIDASHLFLVQIHRDEHKYETKQKGGQHNRNEENAHKIHGIDEDVSKHNSRHSSRCTQSFIIVIVFLFKISRQDRKQQSSNI